MIIDKNIPLPTRFTKSYVTVADKQDGVKFDVYEGESEAAPETTRLASCQLDGLRLSKAGKEIIDVTFSVDEEGVLTVAAKNVTGTKVEAVPIRIAKRGAIPEQEQERMIKEFFSLNIVDASNKARINARAVLEEFCELVLDSAEEEGKDLENYEVFSDARSWLQANQDEDAVDYENKRKELQALLDEITKAENEVGTDDGGEPPAKVQEGAKRTQMKVVEKIKKLISLPQKC